MGCNRHTEKNHFKANILTGSLNKARFKMDTKERSKNGKGKKRKRHDC